ncbi:MAG: hypothetical protein ACI4KF_02640 [Huintestinicola sp.]
MRNIWINKKGLLPSRTVVISVLCGVLTFALPAVMIYRGLAGSEEADRRKLAADTERSIRRNAALCYSIEGAYPENLEYLENNYGVVVNRDKFFVHYSFFGSNISPEIYVIPKDDPNK